MHNYGHTHKLHPHPHPHPHEYEQKHFKSSHTPLNSSMGLRTYTHTRTRTCMHTYIDFVLKAKTIQASRALIKYIYTYIKHKKYMQIYIQI